DRVRFPIVFYDADAPRYLADVRVAAAALDLDPAAPITFRDEALTHYVAPAPPPARLQVLWERLHAARANPA
ncbi:hypothetical protein ABTM76_19225, partial [Acinetobacter baumannii]